MIWPKDWALSRKPAFSIIGCQHGHIGTFLGAMLDLDYHCAGIYEEPGESRRLAESLAAKHGVPLLGRMEDALADEVELVGCSAVNSRKIDVVETCERTGKAIMLDKPAVTNRDGLERLRKVVERGIIETGMLLTQRFSPAVFTLRHYIQEGALGRLVSIAMRKPHRLGASNRPDWFFDRALSGGIIQDLLIHDLDLLRWLTGNEISGSQGYMSKRIMPEHPTFYDAAQLLVTMEDGLAAQLYADWHTPDGSWTWGDCRIFVTGTEGSAELRLQGDPLISRTAVFLLTTRSQELRQVPLLQPPVGIVEDFVNRTKGKHSTLTGADVLNASSAAVHADERAEVMNGFRERTEYQ
ncbi:Gfo/Idh/MocA family protein [Paenibacillus sp. PAMC21692]|uniref:Gfo/Idh/MocA family protein n=1 Tax=Paenibacillus sp. PAMC21692 TaxID=2762320 RepID=UPI00164E362E|nr:Gfo/Idh/MocA family oxidoreductase [Paenibacillus sp. PAMC21692]QNK54898.1 Gfo/Idh/MocA family oxidoreductase [Paenibacillus sp. PAMC21692]